MQIQNFNQTVMEHKRNEAEFTMIDWYKKVLVENYDNFNGRARRSEYWYFTLTNTLVFIGLYIVTIVGVLAKISVLAGIGGLLLISFVLVTLIPQVAVAVRRLHDIGKSGAFLFLRLVPFVSLIFLYFYTIDGEKNDNRYGADPKAFANVPIMNVV